MRQNTSGTTHRQTNTTCPGQAPLPGRAPSRTTAGLVAATLVPAVVVATFVAPVATALVGVTALAVAVALTAARHRTTPAGGSTHDPCEAPRRREETPAD